GLDGDFGDEFVETALPADTRAGLLTQVGFLALNATAIDPDPIHRGKFVSEYVICAKVPAPPDEIPPLPEASEGQTNREVIENLTEQPGTSCATCHSNLLNPFGFPFENYGAVGDYRTEDRETPINAKATIPLDGEKVDVENAMGLIDALAQSAQVHACYGRRWLEFGYGRKHDFDFDEALVGRLGRRSLEGEISVQDLIVGLIQTDSFLTRNAEELP
ncbi:MAG: DUF1588 domain-containing protein, partial [Myxococcales bacterium]|nr:DUF1588 domain-containing protein [Myxococcales bacterium]